VSNKPKPVFYIVMLLIFAGLVVLAVNRFMGDGAPDEGDVTFTPDEMQGMQGSVEATDAAGITTVKEYEFVSAARLPEVKGVSSYRALEGRRVRFAINVWAGWGPIIYGNRGFAAGKQWTTPSGEPFQVELVLIDDPVAMRDTYAAGGVHIG